MLVILAAFFFSLIMEYVFVPAFFGIMLPVAFWFAALVMAKLPATSALWFSLLAGLFYSLFRPLSSSIAPSLFILAALIVLVGRRFLEGEGAAQEVAAIFTGVFSLYFLQQPVSRVIVFLGGAPDFLGAGGLSAAFSAGDFFGNLLFVAAAALYVIFSQRRAARRRSAYV